MNFCVASANFILSFTSPSEFKTLTHLHIGLSLTINQPVVLNWTTYGPQSIFGLPRAAVQTPAPPLIKTLLEFFMKSKIKINSIIMAYFKYCTVITEVHEYYIFTVFSP